MNWAELLLESDDPREAVRQIIAYFLKSEGKTEVWLAQRVKVSQSTIARWQSGASIPHKPSREKLLRLYLRAKCRRWGSSRFFPICAFATSYPADLRERATEALNNVLYSAPLISKVGAYPGALSVDLHIRPAKLPYNVTAYTFANDLDAPTVFVVLVQETLSPAEQFEKGWDEVYAHVVKYSRERIVGGGHSGGTSGQQSLHVSPPVIRTMGHINLQAIGGTTDEGQD